MMLIKCFNLSFSLPPTRSSGKERIWEKWACLERVSLEQFLSLLLGNEQFSLQESAAEAQSLPTLLLDQQVSSVVRIASMDQQWWHYLAESAGPQPWHESAGGTRGRQEKLSAASLRKQISGKTRDPQALPSQLYTQAKLRLHHCPWSPVYTLQTSRVLHGSCLRTCVCLS